MAPARKRPNSAPPEPVSADERRRGDALANTLAKINHDLRNALATATLASPRLADADDPLVQRVLPRLVDAMERAVELCGEALKFANRDAADITPTRFPLHALVAEVGNEIATDFAATRWTNGIDPSVQIEADRARIARAVAELGRNAFENGASEVRVGVTRASDRIIIEIADDGPGLAPRARANLFIPFLSASGSQGSGIGLVLARSAARAHGGDLRLETSGGTGTTFVIELPAP